MKKILFMFMAAFALLLTACNGCGPKDEPEQKSDAVVITSDDWNDLIEKSVIAIQSAYPEYTFYEAAGDVKKIGEDKWGVDHNTFQIVFGKINGNATVIGDVKNDTLVLTQIDEPWLEDVHMTPFVPVDLDLAIKTLQKTIDIAPEGQPAVLRFQLYPNEIEPRFFVGSVASCMTVNCYSMKVNDPLGDREGLWVEHTGLAAKK